MAEGRTRNTDTADYIEFLVKNNEYDQEIPQSETADNPMAPRGRAALNHHETPRRQIKQSNQPSLPHQVALILA